MGRLRARAVRRPPGVPARRRRHRGALARALRHRDLRNGAGPAAGSGRVGAPQSAAPAAARQHRLPLRRHGPAAGERFRRARLPERLRLRCRGAVRLLGDRRAHRAARQRLLVDQHPPAGALRRRAGHRRPRLPARCGAGDRPAQRPAGRRVRPRPADRPPGAVRPPAVRGADVGARLPVAGRAPRAPRLERAAAPDRHRHHRLRTLLLRRRQRFLRAHRRQPRRNVPVRSLLPEHPARAVGGHHRQLPVRRRDGRAALVGRPRGGLRRQPRAARRGLADLPLSPAARHRHLRHAAARRGG